MSKTIENLLKLIAVILFAIWVISQLLSSRYQITSCNNLAYKLDKWTGQVYMINGDDERVVKKGKYK